MAKLLRASKAADCEINLLLAGDGTLRTLNRKFRGIDEATDVLSFPALEGDDLTRPYPRGTWLGDLAISIHKAERQAREFHVKPEDELVALFAHGLAHLMGHDHMTTKDAKAMLAEETRLLRAVYGDKTPPGLVERGHDFGVRTRSST